MCGVVQIWDSFRDRNTYFKDMLIFWNNYLWLCILTFQMRIENSATNLRVRDQLTLIQIEFHIKFSIESYLLKGSTKKIGIFQGKKPLPGLLYLLELEHLREQMEVQMELTAADELKAKFKTRKLEQSNAELIERINGNFISTRKDTVGIGLLIYMKRKNLNTSSLGHKK